MPAFPGEPHDEEPSPEQAVNRAAALDDVLAGLASSEPRTDSEDTSPPLTGSPDMAGLMDTILLLRQAAAADGVVPTACPSPTPRSIGRHAIVKLAGEGGFATVWEGFDTVLRRPVAVKVRRPEALLSESLRRRFVREAEIAARLVHPHIVTIFEVGEDQGREFIAAEFCPGGNLAGWLERHPGPMLPRTAARLCQALCTAAAYAHAAGVVHRDIKPANVLLTPAPVGTEPILRDSAAGLGLTVKLGDFGLGKQQEPDEAGDQLTQLTRSGTSIGTPAWMAPEQIDRSFGDVGPATDVHALGLLLHRLLTGRALRGGGTDAETYRQVLLDEPPAAEQLVRTVPRDLAAVAAKCLAKHPRDRYPTAAALADDLARWLDGRPTLARPLAPAGRAIRWIRRHPVVAGLAAAAVAASLIAAWTGVERTREARVAARQQEAIRRQQAVAELRRGFEALRAGNVAGAGEQLEKTRGIDPTLAESLAGRWLVRRMHGERAILLAPEPAVPQTATRPTDLYSIALAPGGEMAAVAGADGRIRLLRNLAGSPAVTSIAAHDEVNDVGFSADATRLVTAGQDGRVRWWTITDTELSPAGEAAPNAGPLYASVFSPDGDSIAIGGEDRVIRILKLNSQDKPVPLFEFEQPPGKTPEIESLAFIDGGTLAASCGDLIILLEIPTGRVIRELRRLGIGNRNAVLGSLTVSADGRRLMACGTDSQAHVWETATGKILVSLPTHPAWVQGCCFLPDGERVATACRDGSLRVFDIRTGRLLSRLVGHVGRVWSVVAEPDGTLLSCGADGTVRRWNPHDDFETAALRQRSLDGDEILRLDAYPPATTNSGIRPLVALDRAGRVSSLEAEGGEIHVLPRPERASAIEMAVDAPRRRLAVSWLREDHLTLFDLNDTPGDAAPRRDGSATEPKPIRLPTGIDPRQAALCWSHAGELLVCSRAGRICLLTPACDDARPLESPLEDPVHELVIAPSGLPRVAAAGKHTAILPLPRGTNPPSTTPLLLAVGEESAAVAWSPDGATLACGTRSGKTLLFDAATGDPRGALVPHERGIMSAAFSRDGRALVTADKDCVRLSDVATLSTLDEIRPGWSIRLVRLTDDDRRLMIGGRVDGENGNDSARLAIMEIPPP